MYSTDLTKYVFCDVQKVYVEQKIIPFPELPKVSWLNGVCLGKEYTCCSKIVWSQLQVETLL